jgi:ribosomal protein S18 acetylase RimI-like enzyme
MARPMTARAAPRTAARTGLANRTAHVRLLTDRNEVRSRLLSAPAFSAYALAYVDRRLNPLASFYEATIGDRWGLVMHARGGLGLSTLTLGDTEAVSAMLSLHPGPRQTFLTGETAHVDDLLVSHNLWRPQTMLRMRVRRDTYLAPTKIVGARRLLEADAEGLNRLYAIEGEGLHYTGKQVEDGIYYGVEARGKLVSAAGTHIHSLAEGVGVIGNVFTHPDYRGRGYGTAVTAAVAEYLLRRCDIVVLNVDPANRTARHVYESLGFFEAGRLVEAMATRREATTPLPLLRRLLARTRSRTPGVEVVRL